MSSIVWFLLLGTCYQQPPTTTNRADAVKLYQQAAVALQSGMSLEAIPLLVQLVTDQDSKLAPLAAIRLAECYLANDRCGDALKLLMNWAPRVLLLTEIDFARVIDPDITTRVHHLTQTAVAQLPLDQTEMLEHFVKELDSRPNQAIELTAIDRWVVAELARRYANDHRYQESYDLLQRLGKLADSRERKLREFEIPLGILVRQPTPAMIEVVTNNIQNSTNWTPSELFSAKLAVAEAERSLGRTAEAVSKLDQLGIWLQQQSGSIAEQSSQFAHWKITVDLRRAELKVMLGQYRQAAQLIRESLTKDSTYPALHQFRFLLARCLIAEIEFDAARQQLHAIAADASSSPETVAQAIWMLGEIDLMQRNYPAAIAQYTRVVQFSDPSPWQARAMIQMAKCHELTGSVQDAIIVYQNVLDRYPQSQQSQVAQQRLAQLQPHAQAKSAASPKQDQQSPTVATQPPEITPSIQR